VNVALGSEVGPFVIEAVDAQRMKLMAALLRDPNPIHIRAESVRELGLGDRPINQGPSNVSYVLEMVSRWAGEAGTLRSAQVRYLGNVFAGDRVECTGSVTAVGQGDGLVTIEAVAAVEGRQVLTGTFVVAF
jgi:acyl dehydratase